MDSDGLVRNVLMSNLLGGTDGPYHPGGADGGAPPPAISFLG